MKRKFVSNLAFLLALNLLIKPFWIFGIDRSVQNVVGAEEYGLYYALLNFSFLFNILLDAGITNYNNRIISQHEHLLDKQLSGIIILRLLLAVVYCIVSCIVAWVIGYGFDEFRILLVMLFNQAFISFILYLRSNLAGLQLFRTDSIISVLDRLIMIGICSMLLWSGFTGNKFQIEWFVWAQSIAYLITAFIAFFILLNRSGLTKLSWSMPFFIFILKQSFPYAILILLMTFSYRIDSVMLERILPDGALYAGIYAQAYRLLEAASMIAYLFAGLLLPMYARMLKHHEEVESLTRLSFSLIMVPAILAAVCCLVFNRPIMNLLYYHHAAESATVLTILMVCFIPLSSSYIYGTLLTANGNLKLLNYTALGGMILNVLLNLILIPLLKVKGAAIACLITQSATAVAQFILVNHVFHIKVRPGLIFRFISYSVIVFVLFRISHAFNLPLIWQLSLPALAGAGLAFLLKIIRWRDLFFFRAKTIE